MKSLISLFLLSFVLHVFSSEEWCYQTKGSCKGPENWKEINETCGGNRQSPVNIVTKATQLDKRLTSFNLTGYKTLFDSTVKKNSHTIEVTINTTATVSGGNLEDTYKPLQFHLHWGTNGVRGSEHTIDGEQYPMELHVVHIKQKYKDLAEAFKDPFGVAAFGFFLEESNSDNKNFDNLINVLGSIKSKSGDVSIKNISASQFILPEENMTSYYRYNGSLTVPNCYESVIWTVFEKTIPLSKKQLEFFSSLKLDDGTPMVGTFRPPQPRSGRTVYRSSSPAVLASVVLLFISITTTFSLSHLC
ncbi:carbonic anhydrase 4-like [Triplophysa dalaica]|uniref:carbonic anhydrase 4-like n=1 Tax=Triplophysa dalaica TaxID=1582913 RepID=UPI0024DFEDBE|nr:carbonic anhydrase 4-like [Triplophysa dalaica]